MSDSREDNLRKKLNDATNSAKEVGVSLLDRAPEAGDFLLNTGKGLTREIGKVGDLGLNKGSEVIGRMKSAFDPQDFANFVNSTLKNFVVITLYFYLGSSFLLISKSAKSTGGLYGQDISKSPYTGPYSECQNLDFSDSPTDWKFPYKNSVLCDKKYIVHRPFIYRVVSFFVSSMAYSSSTGRQYINNILFSANDTMILFGPILIALIVVLTPFMSGLLNIFGALNNYDKLLPNCYLTFWFPFISSLVFIFGGLFIYPIIMTVIQTIQTILYFTLYPTFGKLDIKDSEGNIKKTNGFFTILKTLLKNVFYMLVVGAMIIINLYTYLDARVSVPIIIVLGIGILSRFLI